MGTDYHMLDHHHIFDISEGLQGTVQAGIKPGERNIVFFQIKA